MAWQAAQLPLQPHRSNFGNSWHPPAYPPLRLASQQRIAKLHHRPMRLEGVAYICGGSACRARSVRLVARLLVTSAAATLGDALETARSSEFDVALVDLDLRLVRLATHRIDQFPDFLAPELRGHRYRPSVPGARLANFFLRR